MADQNPVGPMPGILETYQSKYAEILRRNEEETPEWILFQQGAEAKLYILGDCSKPKLLKDRFKKMYRHPALDEALAKERTRAEFRGYTRCKEVGIYVPHVEMGSKKHTLIIDYMIDTISVKDFIEEVINFSEESVRNEMVQKLSLEIGTLVGTMHAAKMIHGDLTTSNMLLEARGDNKEKFDDYVIIPIDFGLYETSESTEKRAVDLYLLEKAIFSTHPRFSAMFEIILSGYELKMARAYRQIFNRLQEVRQRGRKRDMVG